MTEDLFLAWPVLLALGELSAWLMMVMLGKGAHASRSDARLVQKLYRFESDEEARCGEGYESTCETSPLIESFELLEKLLEFSFVAGGHVHYLLTLQLSLSSLQLYLQPRLKISLP